MYPGQYFMPYGNMITNPRNYIIPGRMGLLGRIGNGIRRFNWGNLLTNANKTLNVVNQTIPLVRQAGPMFNNMRSMLKLAKAFGNETNRGMRNKNNNLSSNIDSKKEINNQDNNLKNNIHFLKDEGISNSPLNFFI